MSVNSANPGSWLNSVSQITERHPDETYGKLDADKIFGFDDGELLQFLKDKEDMQKRWLYSRGNRALDDGEMSRVSGLLEALATSRGYKVPTGFFSGKLSDDRIFITEYIRDKDDPNIVMQSKGYESPLTSFKLYMTEMKEKYAAYYAAYKSALKTYNLKQAQTGGLTSPTVSIFERHLENQNLEGRYKIHMPSGLDLEVRGTGVNVLGNYHERLPGGLGYNQTGIGNGLPLASASIYVGEDGKPYVLSLFRETETLSCPGYSGFALTPESLDAANQMITVLNQDRKKLKKTALPLLTLQSQVKALNFPNRFDSNNRLDTSVVTEMDRINP